MPWTEIDDRWYEVPPGLEPLGDADDLEYQDPEEDSISLSDAVKAGLLLWLWDSGTAHHLLLSETGPQYLLGEAGRQWYVSQSLRASTQATDFLASFVSDGTLSANEWLMLMRQEIKEEYIRQYLLGRGGLPQMAPADWGSIGGMIKEQYHPYLQRFYGQLGELSEAQIANRARMYVWSAREGFERGKRQAALAAGYTEVFWELMPGVRHCDDCIEFNRMGWQLIADDPYGGCFPGSACTACLTTCYCTLIYR